MSFERVVIVLGGRICHLNGERDEVIELLGMPLLTLPPEGGEVLSRTAKRGRSVRPRPLWTPSGRLEPLARCVRALV